MKPTISQVLELEAFFGSITIPKVVKTNAATTFNDAPAFITENIELLKDKNLNELTASTRCAMLQDLKKAILDPVK